MRNRSLSEWSGWRVCGRAAGLALVTAGCASAAEQPAGAEPVEPPSLVVLLTVDQMLPVYLDRFAHQLEGGLARVRGGALFPNGRQYHALTQTAPGHATLLSGRYPAHVGILSNDSGVPDARHALLGSPATGASPERFVGTAFYDWLVAAQPQARALSVSRKDRGAILPLGRARVPVFWFSRGAFTTSTWYADTLPAWAREANARFRAEDWFGRRWTLLLPESAYPEPDDVAQEAWGRNRTFPHALPSDGEDELYSELERFPWTDSLTLAFALEGVRAMRLGTGSATDLLAVSLSTLDGIGHRYGPDSREVHDHVLRIDRWLGTFLDSLERLLPGRRILYAFSSDHGVLPIPEIARDRGVPNVGRVDIGALTRELRPRLREQHGTDFGLALTGSMLLADTTAMRRAGIDVDSLSDALAARARTLAGVRRAFTPREIAATPIRDESDAGMWRRSIPPHVRWLAAFTNEDGFTVGTTRDAQHGTPALPAVLVPIAFFGDGIAAGRYERAVNTVDIAPTLAALLGITPLEPVDGVALYEVAGRLADAAQR